MASTGECHAGTTTAAHGGGYLDLIVAAPAAHLSCTGVCEAPYGHLVLPVWPWPSPNHPDRSHRH
jgi:hypothetical protein